jgi:hypothetical protein
LTATESISIHDGDSNPICGGPAGASRRPVRAGRKAAVARLATKGAGGGAYRRLLGWRLAARLRDSDGGGRVAPRCGDKEETPVEARVSDDEDRRQNRSEQRRS